MDSYTYETGMLLKPETAYDLFWELGKDPDSVGVGGVRVTANKLAGDASGCWITRPWSSLCQLLYFTNENNEGYEGPLPAAPGIE